MERRTSDDERGKDTNLATKLASADVLRSSALIRKMKSMAGGLGFEPRFSESESDVLPLNYPPRGQGRQSGWRDVFDLMYRLSSSPQCALNEQRGCGPHLRHFGVVSKGKSRARRASS